MLEIKGYSCPGLSPCSARRLQPIGGGHVASLFYHLNIIFIWISPCTEPMRRERDQLFIIKQDVESDIPGSSNCRSGERDRERERDVRRFCTFILG